MNPAVWTQRGSRGPGGRRGALATGAGPPDGGPGSRSAVTAALGVPPWARAARSADGRSRPAVGLDLRGGGAGIEVGQRERVGGRIPERPLRVHMQVGVDVDELAALERPPAR